MVPSNAIESATEISGIISNNTDYMMGLSTIVIPVLSDRNGEVMVPDGIFYGNHSAGGGKDNGNYPTQTNVDNC